MSTPREDGLRMPAEWAPHQATLMEWPTRKELWRGLIDEAKRDFATMANAVAAFEPVVMVADPSQESEARSMCGEGVEILPMPIDDSWMRDNGPIFVTDGNGGVALVQFRFNGWGDAYSPYDRDCPDPGTDRVASRHAALPGADGPGGWLVLRGRRGHAAHDRAVPPAPEPQSRHDPRTDRADPAATTWAWTR